MASTLLLDDFNERSKMTEKKYKQKLRSLIGTGGDSYQSAVDDMVEAGGGKLTTTVSHQGKSPEKYQQDVDRMVERGAQLRKRKSKKDNAKMLKEGDPRQTYAEGSLMIPREKYGLGSQVTKLAKNLISAKSRYNKKTEAEKKQLSNKFENYLDSQSNPDLTENQRASLNVTDKEFDEIMLNTNLSKQESVILNSKFKTNFNNKTFGDLNKSQLEYLFSKNSDEEAMSKATDIVADRDEPIPFNQGGSLMMPEEGMPVDTYDNIPPEEMEEAMASQLPDDEMEDGYLDYVIGESLDDSEQQYLAQALQNDPQLGNILDKVMTVASEFSGAGEVEGPGTGVSDSIPARLSDGEFVMTKKATDQLGADNLQVIMDDAERAYDGGYQMKAIGGYMQEDPEQQDSPLSKTDEEIKKLMMGANKMPSLR